MTPEEIQELARAIEQVPGLKGIDFRDVRRLAQLLRERPEIGSIELKGFFGTGVVISRTSQGVAAPAPMMVAAPVAAAAPAAAGAEVVAPAAAPASTLKEIRSPMVGTFYAQPEPGAEAYARVGSRVTSGQTVCIIEAMKIMNEIEAEVTGVVREVCVEDTAPVEYGQVLFRVDPNG
ncbi:MAG TPA: acetyl-CoA carboxylase biotin carboxyl carrier protein [Gemmatimonadales bacterium]|jgi:acetyl-CoA carboxylase biotin carboxyl carrier protein|nr:acetyl-CoA carboxylase biotin carboxyl carrier protein [Gemmatimonadales bacterium]